MSGYTYPGVYIQELPSAVHTITGVPTSIVAFVGWAAQGPTTEATRIQSWQEYQTLFGGLDRRSSMSYAVYQFFAIAGAGQTVYIVRLAWIDASVASATVGTALAVSARSSGAWGQTLQVAIALQPGGTGRFTLQVLQVQSGTSRVIESWSNLSVTTTDPLYVRTVVNNDSQFITITADPTSAPSSTTIPGPTQGAAPTTATTGGTLAAGTYFYVVTALFGNLESVVSAEQSVITTGATSSNDITWTAATNYNGAAPTGYRVYRGSATGQPAVYYNAGAALTFTDTGAQPFTGAPRPSTVGTPLVGATTLVNGGDGTVLVPGDGNFENAMLNDPTGNGLPLLDSVPIFNLLCVPGESDAAAIQQLQQYCHQYRAFYIVDCPQNVSLAFLEAHGPVGTTSNALNPSSGLSGQFSINSAYYYPWVQAVDPLAGNRPALFPPCGFIAGIYAITDATRKVWKAPAGIDASLTGGVTGLQTVLTDAQNGAINVQAINCLRQFPVYGNVVWGARTLNGNDLIGSEWKYVPIRRLALFLESSLYDGTQWVVFEPNDEPLWSQIRLNVGSFMQGLFLQGAFQGLTPQQAYFVKCDAENNPQASINQGIVNILVGFAPLYPAEFVVIQIQQMAGQL